MGKIKNFLAYDKARELLHKEYISSSTVYKKWYKHNKPSVLPLYPDYYYADKGWISWNDFLGNNNLFSPIKKQNFIPYEMAKTLLAPLKFTDQKTYMQAVRSKAVAINVPIRPDYYYKEWFSWKDYLTIQDPVTLEENIQVAINLQPILYIIKTINLQGVFKIDVTQGHEQEIKTILNSNVKIIALFKLIKEFDWISILNNCAKSYAHGDSNDYYTLNINHFIFQLATKLEPYES